MKIECTACRDTLENSPVIGSGKAKRRRVLTVTAAVLCIVAGAGWVRDVPVGSTITLAAAGSTETAAVSAADAETAKSASADAAKSTADAETEKSDSTDAAKSTADADSAATTEDDTETAQDSSDQSDEETTDDSEAGSYTYIYYNGACVPYYRGYYYIDGAWVWRRHGRAPYPPPKFRPALATSAKAVQSRPGPVAKKVSSHKAKSASGKAKSASVKASKVKRTPAKSTPHHHGGGRSSAPRPRR